MSGVSPKTARADLPTVCWIFPKEIELTISKRFTTEGNKPESKSQHIGKAKTDTRIKVGKKHRDTEECQQQTLCLKVPEEEKSFVSAHAAP
jgi:hypothetical protein